MNPSSDDRRGDGPPPTPTAAPGYWPPYMPRHLVKPDTTLTVNLEIAAMRHAARPAIGFLGRDIPYAELKDAAWHCAGWLTHAAGVQRGDRVMIFMQNAPQWLMAFYGVLRADAVVVPANPMYKADEVAALLDDSGAVVIVCAAELVAVAEQALSTARQPQQVRHLVVCAYADYLPATPLFDLPEWVTRRPPTPQAGGICIPWQAVLAASHGPAASIAQPDDLAVINYTSGSTGEPKGCMHSHRTLMHTVVGLCTWHAHAPGTVFLGVVPMYQIGGLTVGVNCTVYNGGTVVPLPRWDRRLAVALIRHYQVRFAGIAPTALIDLLSDPALDVADLASLGRISFGGATMPESVWQTIHDRLGLDYIETYGMTETAATATINPIGRAKRQCLGVAFFDTELRVIDADSGRPCAVGEPGELVVHGPQLFLGYWRKPQATADSFVQIDGKRWFRSGDIGRVDDEGYFHMADRLKRMINASGFKVWPAEVEGVLYGHPAVKEVCVIGTHDPYRGESVKAVVVLKDGADRRDGQDGQSGVVDAQALIDWSRERMAAFKYPRVVEFVDSLPKSPVGKILWRELQDAEMARTAAR